MGPVGNGFGTTILAFGIICAIFVGGIVAGVMTLSKSNELIVKKRLVPEVRLATDGKKVDSVFVYKLK